MSIQPDLDKILNDPVVAGREMVLHDVAIQTITDLLNGRDGNSNAGLKYKFHQAAMDEYERIKAGNVGFYFPSIRYGIHRFDLRRINNGPRELCFKKQVGTDRNGNTQYEWRKCIEIRSLIELIKANPLLMEAFLKRDKGRLISKRQGLMKWDMLYLVELSFK
jgi:hypothetical protein